MGDRQILGVCAGFIASRLAPTLDLYRSQFMCPLKINCGSEPARDGGLTDSTQYRSTDATLQPPAPALKTRCETPSARPPY
ncbi:hypothetical protein EI534_30220 [Pseudomonas frederiksbergensis]|nr:hypothetical protein [Pseudomonas frederiksbergensis]